MKCGDKGHTTRLGAPCQQTIGVDAKGCLWHTRDAAERHLLALKGGLVAGRRNKLPESYRVPAFSSRENILAFVQDLAQRVLIHDVDPRRVDSALRAAGVALTAHAQATQEQLVDALLKIEHGGAALVLLERLQVGLVQGKHRPLPGREALAEVGA